MNLQRAWKIATAELSQGRDELGASQSLKEEAACMQGFPSACPAVLMLAREEALPVDSGVA